MSTLEEVRMLLGLNLPEQPASFCSVCCERCPEPGAVAVENGLPQIAPGICNDVCVRRPSTQ